MHTPPQRAWQVYEEKNQQKPDGQQTLDKLCWQVQTRMSETKWGPHYEEEGDGNLITHLCGCNH